MVTKDHPRFIPASDLEDLPREYLELYYDQTVDGEGYVEKVPTYSFPPMNNHAQRSPKLTSVLLNNTPNHWDGYCCASWFRELGRIPTA